MRETPTAADPRRADTPPSDEVLSAECSGLSPDEPAAAAVAHAALGATPDWLKVAIQTGAGNAAGALSELAGQSITVGPVHLDWVPLSRLAHLGGDPERVVVAVHLGVAGETSGHILLVLSEATARSLADMLLGQPVGTTAALGELEVSALAETGNITGTYFLTALADGAATVLPPTPPLVIEEMCGAILDTLAADLAMLDCDEALVIEADFSCDQHVVDVDFFMLPAPALLRAVGAKREAARAGSR